ncbi:hypothetical protein OBBRIDRAFT_839988 [Obba rivulosa]|uniref:Uncharacterized protein n=1 Tax=Obba rivulosa TaxID=1052685 RepID=A0A8E2ALA1_9APHY|nr:hypothetical protein OBBRIDRAFT_839988 [Obba rivulosa]
MFSAALQHSLWHNSGILSGTPLEIHWTSAKSSKPLIAITVHYEDLIETMESGISNVAEHMYEHDHENAKVTVTFTSKSPDIRREDVKDIYDIAGRRKSILDRLGRSKVILEIVNDYGGALGSRLDLSLAAFKGSTAYGPLFLSYDLDG